MICNIQRFSLHDGQGLRSTVFFKGCPLRCLWCANPESQDYAAEVMFDEKKCIGCLKCAKTYPEGILIESEGKLQRNSNSTQNSEDYRGLCPALAISVVGDEMTSTEIVKKVLKDRLFYRKSFGGVTFSGGEPLQQLDLLYETALRLKEEEINLCLDTCLYASWNSIEKMLPLIDTFLVDIKHTDPLVFKQQTGGNLEVVLVNYKNLIKSGARMQVRIPVIYGFNHSVEEMFSIIDFVHETGHRGRLDLLPYHPLALEKNRMLGREYTLPSTFMDEGELDVYRNYALEKGFSVSIGS